MDADPNATAPQNHEAPDPPPANASLAVHQRKQSRRKQLLSMRFDPDVLEWFRKGPRYQTRMNAVLRAYMEHAHGERG